MQQQVANNRLAPAEIESFQRCVWDYYHQHGRTFSWREEITPYRVFISEVMLQQTQTSRVETKFEEFMGAFTSFHELAEASLGDVLRVWQGLGYNRRAKFLHQCARRHSCSRVEPRGVTCAAFCACVARACRRG